MLRVRLMHWNGTEAAGLQQFLREAGFDVEYTEAWRPALLREWRENPPSVFVIDLSRLPSHGREIAVALRQSPKTRAVPIVFCDGAPEKVDRVRAVLPDVIYCRREELPEVLRGVGPVQSPVQPVVMMDRYGSRTAAQKLGIVEGSMVALVCAPANVRAVLGEMPSEVEFVEEDGNVTLCFVNSVDELRLQMPVGRKVAGKTKFWVLWRKKGARGHNGVTERLVREIGTEMGLVDYKICSVDATWSAMLFARRRIR